MESYRQAEDLYWAGFGEAPKGAYRQYFETIRAAVRAASEAERLTPQDYADRLLRASEIGSEITWALIRSDDEKTRHQFWLPSSTNDALRTTKWTGPSPASPEDLAAAASKYLEAPWMQANLVDWYLINGLVFDAYARSFDAVASGKAFGRTPLSYALAGDLQKATVYGAGIAVAGFAARWVLPPLLMLGLYGFSFEKAIPWIAVPWAVYAAFRLVLAPFQLWQWHKRRQQAKQFQAILEGYASIYETVRSASFSPSRLRNQIRKLQGERTMLPPVVHSLVARLVQRDAHLFSKDAERRGSATEVTMLRADEALQLIS